MATPAVRSLEACGDYSQTVAPYWDQLQEFPWKILDAGFSAGAQRNLYLETNPLVTAFAISLALAPIFLVVSEFNRNYSQVDRCWSLLPTMYIAHYYAWASMSGLPTQRLGYILAFSVAWSARLTYNYWRKGGYEIGSEDYRWEIVKGYVHPAIFFVFNIAFISLAQSILLFLITTPLYVFTLAAQQFGENLSSTDVGFTGGLLLLIVTEWFADGQQWSFYSARTSYRKTARVPPKWTSEELDRGFNVRGLWALSRHPNFAAEQSIWITLYAWSCYTTQTYWNWTGLGAASYVLLFQSSTWLTELISAGKYPEYADYQARVSKFWPKFMTLFTGPTAMSDPSVTMEKKEAMKAANVFMKR